MRTALHPPRSIVSAAKLILAVALGYFVLTMVYYSPVADMMRADGSAPGMITVTALLSLGIRLALRHFILRRASAIAKWLYVGLTLITTLQAVLGVAVYLEVGTFYLFASGVILVGDITACAFLMSAEARQWLASRGASHTDPTVFD